MAVERVAGCSLKWDAHLLPILKELLQGSAIYAKYFQELCVVSAGGNVKD